MSDRDRPTANPFLDDPEPSFHTSSFSALRQGIGQPVAVLVRVTGVGAAEQNKEDPDRSCHRLRLRDMGDTGDIQTVPVADIDLVQRAHDALRSGTRVIVTGRYVPYGRPRRGASGPPLFFHVDEIQDIVTPLDLLGASQAERAAAEARILDLQKEPDGIFLHIKDTLERIFQVSPEGNSARHLDMQRYVVLQNLSAGQVNPMTSDRLSCMVVSGSGTGKKILTEFGRALAPVSAHVEPHNFTAAGLTAVVEQREAGEWGSSPGALPMADQGFFDLQDAHRVPTGAPTAVLRGSLMTVMEDGKVCPTKAARATYGASAAIHINGNWVFGPNAAQVEGDSRQLNNIPLLSEDMLSRFDVVVILDDDEDPARMARAIAMQTIQQLTAEEKEERAKELRGLKVLIGQLIERAPEVDMEPVKEPMGKLMDDITLVLRDATSKLTGPQRQWLDPDSLLRRAANSMRKIVGAAARLDGLLVANESHVKWAEHFMSYKLEIVRWVCSDIGQLQRMGKMSAQVQRAEKAREHRFKEILRIFGGREGVTLPQMSEAVCCGTKLIKRELQQRGIMPAGKGYNIPTQGVWDAQQYMKELGKTHGIDNLGEEPEAKIEIDEEGKPVFEDVLKPVPERFDQVLGAMVNIQEVPSDQDVVAQRLVNSAFDQPDYQLLNVLDARFNLDGYYDKGLVSRIDVHALLEMVVEEPDQVKRGVRALEVYMASVLPDISYYLEPLLKRMGDQVPPEIRVAAEAVLARLRWYDWRDRRRRQSRT